MSHFVNYGLQSGGLAAEDTTSRITETNNGALRS
jgi:hypothetical protein